MVIRKISGRPEITGISSMATRNMLVQLVEEYERLSQQHVAVESVGGVAAFQRVLEGAPFDFVVLAAEAIDRLAAAGRVESGSRVDLARSGVSIAVAAGAPRPEIGNEQAVCDAILAARSIGYSTGPSGAYLSRLFDRWGIANILAPRIVQAPSGVPVGTLVASGEAELGFQQLSEFMHLPGIDIIGSLPPEIQVITVFSAAICTTGTTAESADAAKSLLSFLQSSRADSTKLSHGMEPA
ncbi:molybdate transport system substrate-binding protein [Burkholderia sp. D7]|nr:molybdate transport system substrate-binding protein [Burkholderia sp. D7]